MHMKITSQSANNSVSKLIFFSTAFFLINFFYSQTTYIFTNASASGSLGPTQAQVNVSYNNTNLHGKVISNNGIQTWTVPVSGPYKITSYGAQGACNGGLGAKIEGDFNLAAGQVLQIVVGQQGINGTGGNANNNGGGGGGGSFVVSGTNSILTIAGGGGGGLTGAVGGNGLTTLSGGSSYFGGCGNNGNGGYSGITNGDAAGGGGFITNGQNSSNLAQNVCEGGKSFLNGANGGNSGTNGIYYGGAGGFGGGGSGWHNSINRCGGGGGYSGGQGGTLNSSPACPGGGGGSYNSGSNQLNLSGINAENGFVLITLLYDVHISQTAIIQCNSFSTAALSSTVNGGSAPYTYTWLPTGGNSSIANGLSAGVYTLIVKDNNDFVTSSTHVIAQPAPLNVTAISNNTSVCFGNTVLLNGGGANSYSWSGGVTNGVAFAPSTTNSYIVTGTNTLTGCSATAAINITVKSLPVISLSASTGTMCLNGNQIVLSGIPSGGSFSGLNVQNNLFTPIMSGTFTPVYNYTDPNTGCSNTTTTAILVEICTGINQQENKSSLIHLYPNPTEGIFHIETSNNEMKMIQLVDVAGRIILSENFVDEKITIDISNFSKGIYYLSIKSESGMKTIKVVKN